MGRWMSPWFHMESVRRISGTLPDFPDNSDFTNHSSVQVVRKERMLAEEMEVVHWSVLKRLMQMKRILRPSTLRLESLPGVLDVDRKTFPAFTLTLQLRSAGSIGLFPARINSKNCLMEQNVTNGWRIN